MPPRHSIRRPAAAVRGVLILTALALLALGCRSDPGAGPDDPAPGPARFRDLTAESGLDAVHVNGDAGRRLTPAIMGAGAAVFDHDGDGDLDLYLTNGHEGLPGDAPPGGATNRLFERRDDGRYHDVSAGSGLGDTGYGMGVAIGDVDNDGDQDVYVANLGTDRLYQNDGDGTFTDVSASAGVDVGGWSTSAAFVDLDADGWLDLFVTRYVRFDPLRRCSDPAGREEFCGPEVFPPETDVILHNRGDGRFEEISAAAGIDRIAAAGLGVVCEDFDDDGIPEIYVANDAYANHLWVRRPDGTYEERGLVSGVAYNLHGQPEAGMGVVAADLDGDARPDLFVTHLSEESNTFYRNLGPGRGFGDSTGAAGLAAASMPYTGFGVGALDVELDGDLDLLIAHGRVTRGTPPASAVPPAPWSSYAEPNALFLNDGSGRFDLTPAPVFDGPAEISRALALGDLDGDGDVDVLVTNVAGPARLLDNVSPREGRWLAIRVVDPAWRRDAIGARVRVVLGDRSLTRTVGGGFGYLAGSDHTLHVGLGPATSYDAIEVRWPGGQLERFAGGAVDRRIELRRGDGQAP